MAKLITVGVFTSPWEAHIVKGRLESEGIPVFVAHEYHIWANWMISQALGGVKIQVVSENVELARQILKSVKTGEFEEVLKKEIADVEDNLCPNCGSRKFESKIPIIKIILAVLTLGLFGVIYPPARDKHTCLKCDYKWTY